MKVCPHAVFLWLYHLHRVLFVACDCFTVILHADKGENLVIIQVTDNIAYTIILVIVDKYCVLNLLPIKLCLVNLVCRTILRD